MTTKVRTMEATTPKATTASSTRWPAAEARQQAAATPAKSPSDSSRTKCRRQTARRVGSVLRVVSFRPNACRLHAHAAGLSGAPWYGWRFKDIDEGTRETRTCKGMAGRRLVARRSSPLASRW